MNIMFDTVTERIREIGIRRVCGATRIDIALEFLSQSILVSLVGGLLGLLVGFAIPLTIRLLTKYDIPIPGIAAVFGVIICSLVGIFFGTFPAMRAAQTNPAESLRHE